MVLAQGQVSCGEVPQAGAAQQDMGQAPQLPEDVPPAPLLLPQLFNQPA